MEIRENDKRLCLHRIDVAIIAAVITILTTVTAPSARCARQKSGDFTAIIEGRTAVGGTFDGVMASTGAAVGRRTAMMDSDQGGIFSDVCDHFPPSRHQSRITSEAQFEKGRSDSEVFLTRF
ncbi:hypothetical protein C8J57DRAFT_1232648 [Mycena rebaudengoi]|nr:hypothetical protein C8J57DRAFT_1232648 [Mycena rebaudengoi]